MASRHLPASASLMPSTARARAAPMSAAPTSSARVGSTKDVAARIAALVAPPRTRSRERLSVPRSPSAITLVLVGTFPLVQDISAVGHALVRCLPAFSEPLGSVRVGGGHTAEGASRRRVAVLDLAAVKRTWVVLDVSTGYWPSYETNLFSDCVFRFPLFTGHRLGTGGYDGGPNIEWYAAGARRLPDGFAHGLRDPHGESHRRVG